MFRVQLLLNDHCVGLIHRFKRGLFAKNVENLLGLRSLLQGTVS